MAKKLREREVFIIFRGPILEWIEKKMRERGITKPQAILHELVAARVEAERQAVADKSPPQSGR